MKLRYLIIKYAGLRAINHLLNFAMSDNIQPIKTLVFHHISKKDIDQFYAQIKHIYDNYEIVEPDVFERLLEGQPKQKKPRILITFDDGFKSNALIAEQILKPFGIKAIFFISPGFIDIVDQTELKIFVAKNFFNWRLCAQDIPQSLAPMNWEEITKLKTNGHLIGAHTINHFRLSEIVDESELINEIIGSGVILENKLSEKINHFAFPFGNIGSINIKAMKIIKEKYTFCYSAIRGNNYSDSNHYALLRDPVPIDATTEYLDFIINNGLGLLYRRDANQLSAIVEKS